MIRIIDGNIFESGAQAVVNPVNCVGVMGAGVALQFKTLYPDMFELYAQRCKQNLIEVGHVWVWRTNSDEFAWQDYNEPMYVFNFPTKKHWRDPSQLNWIAEGLDDLRRCVVNLNLNSISIPALGCGYGGLQFEDVSKLVDEKLSDLNTYILLYKPA